MNNKITFPRLATLLADRSGRSKRFSEDFLREFFSLISETLEAQESVKIKGLGTFRLSRVEPRKSVDVTTGEPMEISGHTKVVFTPSKELADAVNAPFEAFTAIEISDDADIDQLFPPEEIDLEQNVEEISSEQDFEAHPLDKEEITEVVEEPMAKILPEAVAMPKATPEPETEPEVKPVTEAALDPKPDPEVESEPVSELEPEPALKPESEHETEPEPEPEAEHEPEQEDEPEDKEEATEDSSEEEATDDSVQPTEEIAEESEEFEEENSRRKTWVRGLMIVFGAAVVALFATFIIWYVFATNDFNRFFNRTATNTNDGATPGFVVGKKISDNGVTSQESATIVDTLSESDSAQVNELEEEVPTVPSDALVYDTISTTRYLTTMAKAHYGNYNLWPYIYQENQSFLGHPDRIRPGTPVVIPKLSKYGVDPNKKEDIEKAKKLGVEIYARYGKKI